MFSENKVPFRKFHRQMQREAKYDEVFLSAHNFRMVGTIRNFRNTNLNKYVQSGFIQNEFCCLAEKRLVSSRSHYLKCLMKVATIKLLMMKSEQM